MNKISSRSSVANMTPHDKVDIDVLKKRMFYKKKKEKMHSRIIIASAILSIGVISFFAG